MKSALVFLAIFTISTSSMANSKWIGNGEEFSPDGKILGTYQIEVTNTEVRFDTIQSKATVTLQDGSQKVINQTIKFQGTSWTVVSDSDKGGGACYGQDICENYIQGENGLALATTIIQEGEAIRRNITFVLENGKAIKVLKDKLTKVQQ